MTTTPLDIRVYDLSHLCGLNQRYFQQSMANALSEANTFALCIAGVTLAGLVATAISTLYYQDRRLTRIAAWSSLFFAIAAVGFAMVLNVHPIAAKVQQFSELYVRWSDLRSRVDALLIDVQGHPKPDKAASLEYERQYHELWGSKSDLIAQELFPTDKTLLERCWQDENESRTGYRTTDPNEQKHTGSEYDTNGNPKSKSDALPAR